MVGGAADGGSPEANANVDERPDDEKSKDAQEPFDLAHALPGAVLTVFVGATAFLGLKTTEVDDILRNQAVIPSLVALLLLASVIVSILSMTDRYGKITVARRSLLSQRYWDLDHSSSGLPLFHSPPPAISASSASLPASHCSPPRSSSRYWRFGLG